MATIDQSTPKSIREGRPFPNLPESVVIRRLGQDPAVIVNQLNGRATAIALRLANTQNARDFLSLREEVWEKYFRLRIALNNVVAAEESDRRILNELTEEALSAQESFFSSDAVDLGNKGREEVLFCLFTLRRVYKLLDRIYTVEPPDQCKAEDAKYGAIFTRFMSWSALHLDCLITAVDHKISIAPDVTAEILCGLRAIVMAYSCVRQGVELRESSLNLDLSHVSWDDEDRMLADHSTTDRESTLNGW